MAREQRCEHTRRQLGFCLCLTPFLLFLSECKVLLFFLKTLLFFAFTVLALFQATRHLSFHGPCDLIGWSLVLDDTQDAKRTLSSISLSVN